MQLTVYGSRSPDAARDFERWYADAWTDSPDYGEKVVKFKVHDGPLEGLRLHSQSGTTVSRSCVTFALTEERARKLREDLDKVLGPTLPFKVYHDIEAERLHQRVDRRYDDKHDDQHTMRDWVSFITYYLAKAVNWRSGATPSDARAAFVKVAALAVAAVEAIDRKSAR